mgnify:FL=1
MNQKLTALTEKAQLLLSSLDKNLAQFIVFVRLNKVHGAIAILALVIGFILLLVLAILQEWLFILNLILFFANSFLWIGGILFITYFVCKKLHRKFPFKGIEETMVYKALTQDISKKADDGEDWELIDRMKQTNAEWQEKYKSIVEPKKEEPKIKM